jgi:hypothetical protein
MVEISKVRPKGCIPQLFHLSAKYTVYIVYISCTQGLYSILAISSWSAECDQLQTIRNFTQLLT